MHTCKCWMLAVMVDTKLARGAAIVVARLLMVCLPILFVILC